MAKVEIKERAGCTRKLHVEIEREQYDRECAVTLKKLKRDIQLPGFRKGKAPESLISRRIPVMLREETIKELIPKVLREVWESEKIKPVGEPMISDLHFEETGPISFTVTVEELLDFDVSGFKNVRVTREVIEINDDDIDNALEQYRRMRAQQKDVDRGAKEGDLLVVNLQELDITGVPIIGKKREREVVELSTEGPFTKDTIESLIGMKKGDRRPVMFEQEEADYPHSQEPEAKMFDVEVVRVIENNIPELSDEFAASTGVYTDLADLREKTRDHLRKQADMRSERKLHTDLIDEFIKKEPFEVPDSMVRRIMFSELENTRKNYPEQQFDEEAFLREIRPDSVRAVQTYLIIEAVKARNNIEVPREETNARIEEMARENHRESREFRRQLIKDGRIEDIRNSIAQKKAYEWMNEQAEVTVETVKRSKAESNIIVP